jgi:hypothetical protein
VLEFSEVDDNDKVHFNDLTYDSERITKEALDDVADTAADQVLTLGSLGSITLGWNAANEVLYWNATGYTAESEYGAEFAVTNGQILITSPDADSDVQGAANVFNLSMSYDSTDDEIDVAEPAVSSGAALHASDKDKAYNDNDVQMYVSAKGVLFEYDQDDASYVTISYPEEDVYGNVFIAPLNAETSTTGAGGTIKSDKVNAIPVGMAALDSDAEIMDKNMIVVGGPCINTIADELVAPTGECYDMYESGKATIKLYDRGGKVALLVAGMDAADTRAACRVLAQYSAYEDVLTGSEVEVSGSISTNIRVTTPTA